MLMSTPVAQAALVCLSVVVVVFLVIVVVVVVVFLVVVAMMPMVTRGHDEAVTVWPLAADLLPASAAPLPQARPHPTTLT